MKKFVSAVLAVVLVLAMSVSAFATPSIYRDFSAVNGGVYGGRKLTVIAPDGSLIDENLYNVQFSDVAKDVADEVKNASGDLSALVPNLADYLPAGVNVSDLTVVKTVDVSIANTLNSYVKAGCTIRIYFNAPDVKKGDFVLALHKGANGWEVLPTSAVGLHNVAVDFTTFSPVAFVTLKGVKVDGSVTSPATGLELAPVANDVVAACAAAL